MTVSASQLRQDIYNLLDSVIETGEPLEIERKGTLLRIVPERRIDWIDRIAADPDFIVGDPEDLVSVDWSVSWDADRAVAP